MDVEPASTRLQPSISLSVVQYVCRHFRQWPFPCALLPGLRIRAAGKTPERSASLLLPTNAHVVSYCDRGSCELQVVGSSPTDQIITRVGRGGAEVGVSRARGVGFTAACSSNTKITLRRVSRAAAMRYASTRLYVRKATLRSCGCARNGGWYLEHERMVSRLRRSQTWCWPERACTCCS